MFDPLDDDLTPMQTVLLSLTFLVLGVIAILIATT